MKKKFLAILLIFCILLTAGNGFSALAQDLAASENTDLSIPEEPIAGDDIYK